MSDVTLEPVDLARRDVLDRLFQLYAHDFSAFLPLPLGEDGRFDERVADKWFEKAEHYAFFIRQSGALAGFALVWRGSHVVAGRDTMDVSEFFVVRGARRARVGMRAVHALFERFPGPWEIRVRQSNPDALAFWESVATLRTTFEQNGAAWWLLTNDAHDSAQHRA